MPGFERGENSLHVAEPLITPRTRRHPPIDRRGNMYVQAEHRTAGFGAVR